GNAVYDTTCFGVDAAEQLSDDRYMIFYNQLSSPAGEITLTNQGDAAVFEVQLQKLPASIAKLVFTVSIDGNGRMGQIRSHTVEILQNGTVLLQMEMTGKDFLNERAIISMEIYLKSVWRVNAVARGFNGGLSDLLANFGGEEADDAAPAPQPAPAVPAAPAYAPAPVRPVPVISAPAPALPAYPPVPIAPPPNHLLNPGLATRPAPTPGAPQ
ncbi:MAG: TerD family protein, partial [Kiritimatiellae bacterium]|nr:TerD family protein [Kiritimatiellia bacterium]